MWETINGPNFFITPGALSESTAVGRDTDLKEQKENIDELERPIGGTSKDTSPNGGRRSSRSLWSFFIAQASLHKWRLLIATTSHSNKKEREKSKI